ncbi:MAG: hypothetical protein A3K19_22835 [Lentisphaerae bacterium RIFOXYB12_FULL_65_16]|nr:MAG: hypothetical protein A3K18_16920 [Lentisphaerae bacterium RIFOXYA12_64_32]OGV90047.1 MAG: hypothetical protein A3K19_22835 [Lentisphaerae bacterium RIFOXYB12_FULL_65_16]
MKNMPSVFAVAVAVVSMAPVLSGAPLRVDQEPDGPVLVSDQIEVRLAAQRGYAIASVRPLPGDRVLTFAEAGLVLEEDAERDTWTKAYFGAPTRHVESKATASLKSVQEGAEKLTVVTEWECPAGTVQRELTLYADAPVLDVVYTIQATRRLAQACCQLRARDAQLYGKAEFVPTGDRPVARMPEEAVYTPAPGWAYISDGAVGFGLAAEGDGAISRLLYPPSSAGAVEVAMWTPSLRWRGTTPGTVTLKARLLLGAAPESARNAVAGMLPPMQVLDLDVTRRISEPGAPGAATARLTNNTATAQSVRLQPRLVFADGKSRDLPEQALELPPRAETAAALSWDNSDVQYGCELNLSVVDSAGKELGRTRDWFAVSDRARLIGPVSIFNPGWMKDAWMTPRQVGKLKETYFGVLEYYCWAPDQVLDLTPDTEEWSPHTESQAAYATRLTRTFLQDVVRQAHESGLYVLAMDTGMLSLDGALRRPELAKYTADGQMYLYNGAIHDGKRYNAVCGNVFSNDVIRAWAEEMAASVDLFGWDGVRFDWNFLPAAPQDPLQVQEAAAGGAALELPWYDIQGRKSTDLFPNPDAAAAEFCRVWRETVTARHPRFSFNINYSVNHGLFKDYPAYSEVNCRDAGILMESLLGTATQFPTWQAWAEVLTESLRTVRPCGSVPFVGWMRGYAPGGITLRVEQYVMMASGFRWYGSAQARHSIDDTWKRFAFALRFAEYFYDPGFTPLGPKQKRVTTSGDAARVLWAPFVFERTREGERQTLVHLVNLPEHDEIFMHHDPPPARAIQVELEPEPGWQAKRAWAFRPDPTPTVTELPLTRTDGRVTVTVPDLTEMTSVVFEQGK